ncbi:MAG TPA: SDR family NAD(P)-dependent oxidoreductase, partial [Tepidisphaeraceae bacterium]|nr:SDR family NAD(P)-dependent oxidoreductase [Tepidisphaeraceae bacterium]
MADYEPKTLLITGGAGFIGSNFVRMVLDEHPEVRVVNLDKLTYAGNLDNLDGYMEMPNHIFVQGDIGDATLVARLLAEYEIDAIVNFAAESHVDRSITDPDAFIASNISGVFNLLQCALDYKKIGRIVQVGTDEVYGALTLHSAERFREDWPLVPRSPYSATKAAADHLCFAWHHTYGLPTLVT